MYQLGTINPNDEHKLIQVDIWYQINFCVSLRDELIDGGDAACC